MANLAYTVTLTPNTTASATAVQTNFATVGTWLNNRDNASDYWLNMKVLATASNPVDISSSASTTELSINNSATDGDPIVTWKLSGSQTHVIGVDDSDSDFLKFATTSIVTNVAMQIPTVGSQVQLAGGSSSLPGISWIGDPDSGIYLNGANDWILVAGGAAVAEVIATSFRSGTDAAVSLGDGTKRWSALWSANGTIQTCHSSTKKDIEKVRDTDIRIPEAIKFNRPADSHSSKQLGFMADDLPEECFAVIDDIGTRSTTDIYLSSVVGLLCAAVKKIEHRVSALE